MNAIRTNYQPYSRSDILKQDRIPDQSSRDDYNSIFSTNDEPSIQNIRPPALQDPSENPTAGISPKTLSTPYDVKENPSLETGLEDDLTQVLSQISHYSVYDCNQINSQSPIAPANFHVFDSNPTSSASVASDLSNSSAPAAQTPHTGDSSSFECNVCGKTFSRQYKLRYV
jgi:hypothetical protein